MSLASGICSTCHTIAAFTFLGGDQWQCGHCKTTLSAVSVLWSHRVRSIQGDHDIESPMPTPQQVLNARALGTPTMHLGLTMATAGEPVTATRLSEMDGAIVRPPC